MAMMIVNDISYWYAYEYANECVNYNTNMSSNDFTHGLLTLIKIFSVFDKKSFLLNIEDIYLFWEHSQLLNIKKN